jgi:hypothetical protein
MGALPTPGPFLPPRDPDEQADPGAPQPAGPVLLVRTELPTDVDRARRAAHAAGILRPFEVSRVPAPAPAAPRVSSSFRSLLAFAAIAIVLAVCLALILGTANPRPASPKPAAAPTSVQTGVAVHPAKPSAYGEAFLPPPAAPRHHRSAPASAQPPPQRPETEAAAPSTPPPSSPSASTPIADSLGTGPSLNP